MSRTEEGVLLQDDVLEVIAYLQDCFDRLNRGEEGRILGDPFYRRPDGKPPMTAEEVDRVVAAIDEEFGHEIGAYPGYHRNRSGANSPADFHRLSPGARRAMVEGLEAILARHKPSNNAQAAIEPSSA